MMKRVEVFLFLLNLLTARGSTDPADPADAVSGGTYDPRNAWLLVDSRRRVLPDIDISEHFQEHNSFTSIYS